MVLFHIWRIVSRIESCVCSLLAFPLNFLGALVYETSNKTISIEGDSHSVLMNWQNGAYASINTETGELYMTPVMYIMAKLGLLKGNLFHEYGHYISKAPNTDNWWSRRLSEIRADLISVKMLKKHYGCFTKAIIVLEFILEYLLSFEWISRLMRFYMDEQDRKNPDIIQDVHPTDLSRLKYILQYADKI